MEPLFADPFANAGRVVLNFLAIAGGFLIGNWLMLVICRIVAKLFLKRQLPVLLEKSLRVLAGIAVAILVAFLVFGDGGWGFGGSGGAQPGGPGGSSSQQESEGKDKRPPKDPNAKPKDLDTIVSPVVRVRVGRATDYPKTFRFEGESEGVDLAEARRRLAALSESVKGEPRLELQVYLNSTESGHPTVRELIDYAHTLRFSTRVDKINDRLP